MKFSKANFLLLLLLVHETVGMIQASMIRKKDSKAADNYIRKRNIKGKKTTFREGVL